MANANLQPHYLVPVALVLYALALFACLSRSETATGQELRASLKLNFLIFLVGVATWLILNFAEARERIGAWLSACKVGTAPSERSHGERLLPRCRTARIGSATSIDNYLLYLLICMYSCLVLAVVDFVILFLYYGKYGWAFFDGSVTVGNLSNRHNPVIVTGFWFRVALGIVNGVIALFFAHFYRNLVVDQVLDKATANTMQRTVWLTQVPREDQQTHKPFELDLDQLRDVRSGITKWFTRALGDGSERYLTEMDLKEAIDELRDRGYTIQKQGINGAEGEQGATVIEDCQVSVVLDQWCDVRSKLILTKEYIEAYEKKLLDLARACEYQSTVPRAVHARYAAVARCWYARKLRQLRSQEKRLELELDHIINGKRRLSGSAFVTFKEKKDLNRLLQEFSSTDGMWWWHRLIGRSYTYFSFGRPPFRSVTLKCEAAPPPEDVEWTNLHIGKTRRTLAFIISAFVLLILMLLLTTTVTVTSMSGSLSGIATYDLEWIKNMTAHTDFNNDTKAKIIKTVEEVRGHYLQELSQQLPTMLVLAINSGFLPSAIEFIGNIERCHLKSKFEKHQKGLNYRFLLINTILCPFLGVTSIGVAAELYWKITTGTSNAQEKFKMVLHLVENNLDNISSLYAMKYLINCAFLSSMLQLVNFSQGTLKALTRPLCVTDREKEDNEKPWPFAWGYWYAWTLSIYFLTLLTSFFVPAMLPLAAIFFYLKYEVDKFNLRHNVYATTSDMGGALALTTVQDMRQMIAGAWFLLGLSCVLIRRVFPVVDEDEDFSFKVMGVVLIIASCTLSIWSQLMERNDRPKVKFFADGSHSKPTRITSHFFQRLGSALDLAAAPPDENVPEECEIHHPAAQPHWNCEQHLRVRLNLENTMTLCGWSTWRSANMLPTTSAAPVTL